MPHLTTVSDHARAIGAVNTITVKHTEEGSRILYGDNSDWKAIKTLAFKQLPPHVRLTENTTGLVIGAGGTCRAAVYAIHQLGVQTIYLYNRTRENAEKVAKFFPKDFNIVCVTSLDELPAAKPSVIVSTVPGGSMTLDEKASGILLKPTLLNEAGGVAIEMAYRPKVSALIELAQATENWAHVFGVDILLEQAFVQFEGWTKRKAPRNLQIAAVQQREKERDAAAAAAAEKANFAAKRQMNGKGTMVNGHGAYKDSPMTSFPPAAQIEYSSSAPMPTQSASHTVSGNDPEVPTHLYQNLPKHLLVDHGDGKEPTPDYLRMILLCKLDLNLH